MIGPGWLPPLGPGRARTSVRPRPLPRLRRRITRRRFAAAPAEVPVDNEIMLFDQGRELPVATVRRAPRSKLAMLAGDLSRWVATRWDWFRPRTVPVLVAFAGMLAMLQAVSYLSGAPHEPTSASVSEPVTVHVAEPVTEQTTEHVAEPMTEQRAKQFPEVLGAPHRAFASGLE